MSFETNFYRLLSAITEGRVVPFVGAGFSLVARHENNEEFEPSVEYLCEKVNGFIDERLSELSEDEKKNQLDLLLKKLNREKDLAHLAEIGFWLEDYKGELLRCIEIEKFSELTPSPAHYYLAYLAREGLVEEVISTNYDSCIEKAYSQSLNKNDASVKLSDYGVVHDLGTYRQYGGKRTSDNKNPFLTIHKINGCATDFSVKFKENKIEDSRVVITERQLQAFGLEQWANDLLRDRARSRALLFIGFGSDEPQVRHRILALMNEFQVDPQCNASEKMWDQPNAPFMSVYEKELSFSQMQIMLGYILAHEKNDSLAEIENNIFSGKNTEDFALKKDKLPADDFMRRVYQGVFQRLLTQSLSANSPFYQWLENFSNKPAYWANFPSMLPMSQKNFGVFYPLLESCQLSNNKNDRQDSHYLILMRWLRVICTSGKEDSSRENYFALRDYPIFILGFLLFISVLLKVYSRLWIREIEYGGLEISWRDPFDEDITCRSVVLLEQGLANQGVIKRSSRFCYLRYHQDEKTKKLSVKNGNAHYSGNDSLILMLMLPGMQQKIPRFRQMQGTGDQRSPLQGRAISLEQWLHCLEDSNFEYGYEKTDEKKVEQLNLIFDRLYSAVRIDSNQSRSVRKTPL